ncbi:MAG: transposase, partial [Synergistaceae bacterium]|nr:transposase [Synergistaceae bacterium]
MKKVKDMPEKPGFSGMLCYHYGMENVKLVIEQRPKSYKELEKENIELKILVKQYDEQIILLQRKKFSPSSEKTENSAQLLIFNEAENEANPRVSEPTLEQITYTRRKRVGKREEDLSKLPVKRIVHSLPEEERICPECGEAMHVMGHSEP